MGKRSCCLRRLGGSRAGAVRFSRFLRNERVRAEEIAATAAEHTARAVEGRHVLAIQDTTDLNFAAHAKSKRGFGDVSGPRGLGLGLFVHPVIVVEAAACGSGGVDHAGGILGLAGAFVYRREPLSVAATARRPLRDRTRPIASRESGRWLDGLRAAAATLARAATATVVGDRESDIYEVFAAPRPPNLHLLVRAQHDRALCDGGRLREAMEGRPHAAGETVAIPPSQPGRPARSAALCVAFADVLIKRPVRVYGGEPPPRAIDLRAVHVAEADPPPGVEPVSWLLLTTHAVESLADALKIVEWYRARWTVEQLFRTLKTQGFEIEESQVETYDAMRKLVMAALVAAVRALQLVHARTGRTGQRLADALDEADEPLVEALVKKLEGKTERLKCPHPQKSLARLAWVVGRLGGWDGYAGKSYKPAGPKTIAIGLIQFDAIRTGWTMPKDV